MMSGIGSKNTKPEVQVRKALFARGFRYRLHEKKLPGKPDLVFPKYRAVIFIHGCFWHGHGCSLFRWPSSNIHFWKTKITHNQERDHTVIEELSNMGWRVLTVWECAIKGYGKWAWSELIDNISEWLISSSIFLNIDEKIKNR